MFIFYMCKHNESFLIMQLFARFFRPSGALFGTSAVGDKARRASDRPWTGRAHRSTDRCSAVTVPKRPMPTGSVASPNGWRPACRGMRRLGGSDNADMSDHPDNRHRAYRRSCPSMYVQQVKQMIFASASLHRFSPPLLREAEIMPEAGLRTLRRTAECSGRGRRAGRTRRSPLSF